jgi:hypothetical protein
MRFHVSNACSRVRGTSRVLLSLAAIAAFAGPAIAQSNGRPQGDQCYVSNSDQAAAAAAAQAQCNPWQGSPYTNQPACSDRPCRCGNPNAGCAPLWTLRADELVLQRGGTRDQTLFRNAAGADVLNSEDDLRFPVAVGFQISGIHQIREDRSVEVGYFQLDGWQANNNVPDATNMITDNKGDQIAVTGASARYTSAIYLGEVNVRQQVTDWFTVLGGMRLGELDERYSAGGAGGTLHNNAFNHLYGGQVGADLEVYNDGTWRLNGLCKAGLFANYVNQNSSDGTTALAASDQRTAFLGEVGTTLTYQVNEHFAVRAICQATWLQGVALAPEQARANDFGGVTAGVDATGSLFYYGGGVGCELKF